MSRGYLISEGLKDRIHSTIERVEGTPYGGLSDSRTPRVEGGLPATGGDTISVKISRFWPTLDHTPLAVGQGLAVPLSTGSSPQSRIDSGVAPDEITGTSFGLSLVSSEAAIPAFSGSLPELTIGEGDRNVLGGTRCGVISSVSEEPDENGYWVCRVRVRGIVKCRVLMLQGGNSVIPPPPYPELASLRPFWRRYLTVGVYGFSTLIGIGAYRSLMSPGTTRYPAVAEAAVFLG